MIGIDKDETLFKIFAPSERKCFSFSPPCNGPRRCSRYFMLQMQMVECGVMPTWSVDKEGLQDYQHLGIKAVVGRKLTEARNKAFQDARKLRKVCAQVSDNISA